MMNLLLISMQKLENKIIKSLLKSDKTMIIISHHMPKNLVSLFDQVINL